MIFNIWLFVLFCLLVTSPFYSKRIYEILLRINIKIRPENDEDIPKLALNIIILYLGVTFPVMLILEIIYDYFV
ncbi:hypothetical protein [Streptococcus sp. zg-JUN1979]|uniref:hypothetical protein n=1 Tax=Streptococcus sp. zg-JUN1979 TaxID=3391450 RepID=UPI0039A5EC3E